MQTETQEAPLTQEVTPEAPPLSPESEVETPQTATPPAQVSRETEDKARDMGWVPQAEWRGDPQVWRPANEYVRRGEEYLPIVNARARKAEAKVQALEAQLTDLPGRIKADIEKDYSDRFRRLEGMSRVALDKQRERIWADFEAQKRKAVSDANTDEFDRLTRDQHEALANFQPEREFESPAVTAAPAAAAPAAMPPAIKDWVASNEWFNRDPELTALATAHHGKLLSDMPGLTLSENLSRVTDYVKKRFPDKFGISPANGATPHAPQVEGGGRQPGSVTPREKAWGDIPAEDRKLAETQIEYFLPVDMEVSKASPEDMKKARATYAREYWKQF